MFATRNLSPIWLSPIWIAGALALLVMAFAFAAHARSQNDTEITAVPLDASNPDRTRVGDLIYLGGIDIPAMGQNIGGLSALRWDAQTGRLLALTDDARWVWMTPAEDGDQLTGINDFKTGPLLGLDGEPLTGKSEGDSESLTAHSRDGGWLIGFERDHRVWHYPSLTGTPEPTKLNLAEEFGPLEGNAGIETLGSSARVQMGCVERAAAPSLPNCMQSKSGEGGFGPRGLAVYPPQALVDLGGVPTDADVLSDDTALILFRSYSRSDGNGAAVVAYSSDDQGQFTRREIATLRPPLSVDNFEGLALREEAGRTFLYLISDDNFSSNQRTLLMKFEIAPQP